MQMCHTFYAQELSCFVLLKAQEQNDDERWKTLYISQWYLGIEAWSDSVSRQKPV